MLVCQSCYVVLVYQQRLTLTVCSDGCSNARLDRRKCFHQLAPAQDMAASVSTSAVVCASDAYRDAAVGPLRKLSVDLIKTYKHINEVSVVDMWDYITLVSKSGQLFVFLFPTLQIANSANG